MLLSASLCLSVWVRAWVSYLLFKVFSSCVNSRLFTIYTTIQCNKTQSSHFWMSAFSMNVLTLLHSERNLAPKLTPSNNMRVHVIDSLISRRRYEWRLEKWQFGWFVRKMNEMEFGEWGIGWIIHVAETLISHASWNKLYAEVFVDVCLCVGVRTPTACDDKISAYKFL